MRSNIGMNRNIGEDRFSAEIHPVKLIYDFWGELFIPMFGSDFNYDMELEAIEIELYGYGMQIQFWDTIDI